MKKNVGKIDSLVRIIIAAALVYSAYTTGIIVLYVLAGIMAVTAVIGWCPLYTLFKINTCKVGEK